jgi:ribosomal protein S18 acetylase RimI-like enzyme
MLKIKKITRFSQKIYKAVLKLLPQLVPASELPSDEYFKGIIRSKHTHFFIAELGNKDIIGILTVAVYNIPTGTKFWIEDVVVDETHRGKGYGKELMLYAIGFARSAGAKSIELTSRPSRIAANQLYKNMGFELRETNVYRYRLDQKDLNE